MLQFLQIFLFILICFFVCESNNKKKTYSKSTKVLFVLCLVVLGVLAAFRAETVGNDTIEYARIFESSKYLIKSGTRYEVGYLYFNLAIHKISDVPQVFFLVSSIIIYTIYGAFIWRYSKKPMLSLLFFFLIAYCDTMIIMRQTLAICLLFFCVDFIVNRQFVRFLLFVCLASLFHTTAILFLFAYPLSFVKPTKKIMYVAILISLVCTFAFNNLMEMGFSFFTMYEGYTNSKYFEGSYRIASVINLFFSLMILFGGYFAYTKYSTKLWKESKGSIIFRILLNLQIVAVFIGVLCLKVNLLDRLMLYFSLLSFVLISNSISMLPLKIRNLTSFFVIFFYVAYNCIVIVYRPEWNNIYPIKLVWKL